MNYVMKFSCRDFNVRKFVLDHCDSGLEWQRRTGGGGGIINESLDIVESGEKMMEWPDTDNETT